MKQYRLIYSKLIGCVFLLLSSFCIFFVTTTHSQVIHHRRLWPWPLPESGPGPPPGPYPSPHNKTTPAVFFFGDSIIDTGNNNNLTTEMRCNFPPYGIDFPFGVATGRFSNGKVTSDYISEYLGLKPIVPAYFDSNVQPEDLLTGVSFASGGSGYYHLTPKISSVKSMLDQLTYFQHYIARVKTLVGQEKTDQLLAKGLSVVVAGSNDLIITYYGQGAQWLKDDIHHYTSKMANSATSFVMQLYEYGARQIAVLGTPPLGCVPLQRTLKGGLRRDCAQDINFASQLFNAKLSIKLDQLAKTLPNSNIIYVDIYSAFSHILENSADYGNTILDRDFSLFKYDIHGITYIYNLSLRINAGFEEIKKGCCGTGFVEVGPLCNRFTPFVCSNVSAYLFWDSFHPTQRFYEILTKILVKKYIHNLN